MCLLHQSTYSRWHPLLRFRLRRRRLHARLWRSRRRLARPRHHRLCSHHRLRSRPPSRSTIRLASRRSPGDGTPTSEQQRCVLIRYWGRSSLVACSASYVRSGSSYGKTVPTARIRGSSTVSNVFSVGEYTHTRLFYVLLAVPDAHTHMPAGKKSQTGKRPSRSSVRRVTLHWTESSSSPTLATPLTWRTRRKLSSRTGR